MDWQVGRGESPDEWHPAEVPGAVQLDWARAQGWPEWWKGQNHRLFEGLEDSVWTLRTILPPDPAPRVMRFEGIDDARPILVSGDVVHLGSGPLTPVEVEIPASPEAEVEVRAILHPA
ncbi:MAG: hypothetical protein MH204_06155, partial [Fimbriimonadaceae bacterium]|nr:hypothetical protein [Fimbriimonadaceae bacterium]